MALLAVAADKGSPGVTTTAIALAAVWPQPVLLAECDPAGGDLAFRLPGPDRAPLDARRGLLSMAVAARRGVTPDQVWEHVQKMHGGLDVLAGVTSAEQGAGLEALWGTVGAVLAALPQADVIADCGRIGVDGPFYDLLAQAAVMIMISGASLGEVIRLRDRAAAVAAGLHRRGRPGAGIQAVIIASPRHLASTLGEVGQALGHGSPVSVVGGIAHDPKGAESLRGAWGGKLDKSMLIRTARQIATVIAGQLPATAGPAAARPASPGPAAAGPGAAGPAAARASSPGLAAGPAAGRPSSPGLAAGPAAGRASSPGLAPAGPAAAAPVAAAPVAAPVTAGARERAARQSPDTQDGVAPGAHRPAALFPAGLASAAPAPAVRDASQAGPGQAGAGRVGASHDAGRAGAAQADPLGNQPSQRGRHAEPAGPAAEFAGGPFPAGQFPGDQHPAGQVQAGQFPGDQHPAGQVRAGQFPGEQRDDDAAAWSDRPAAAPGYWPDQPGEW